MKKNIPYKKIENFINNNGSEYEIFPLIGYIITGSYVLGLNTKGSDIDIIIITDNHKYNFFTHIKNRKLNIDLFISTTKGVQDRIAKDYNCNTKVTSRMFYIGEIVKDNKNIIKDLKDKSSVHIQENFVKREIKEIEYKYLYKKMNLMKKYYQDNPNYKGMYISIIYWNILPMYCKIYGEEIPFSHEDKRYKFLYNHKFQHDYYIKRYDKDFLDDLKKCLKNNEIMDLEKLIKNYIYNNFKKR